jgi:hypothetical protein
VIETGHEHQRELAGRDAAILPALGRLIRGLSAMFWGLPVVLVSAVQGAKADPARPVHLWSEVASFALVFYGVHMLSAFHPQERVWQSAVDRARVIALINLGFSPFVYWWNRYPGVPTFQAVVDLLAVTFLLFLLEMSPVLDRLVAMLPDEALRLETRFFTRISRFLLTPVIAVAIFYFVLLRLEPSFPFLTDWLSFMAEGGMWMMLFLVLLPLAITMALLWKIKEVIFHSVFRH